MCQSGLPQDIFFSLSILLIYLCTRYIYFLSHYTIYMVRGQLICVSSIQLVFRHHQWSSESKIWPRSPTDDRPMRQVQCPYIWWQPNVKKDTYTVIQVYQSPLTTQLKERGSFFLFFLIWGMGERKKESLIKMVYVLDLARRVEFDRQNEKKKGLSNE